jgi:YegS/Rv2252/BmrU family lipid kinase
LDIPLREDDFLLAVNPAAGRGRGLKIAQEIRETLERFGLSPRSLISSHPGDIYLKVKDAALSGMGRIVVIGGDGSVQEAASGIAGTGAELGIVPAGSGNDFIKSFGIPNDAHRALEVALCGQVKSIDMGMIGERYFVNMVGIGFDALVAAENLRLKYPKGFTGYLYALAKVFFRYKPPHITLESDNLSFEGKILLTSIGNGICCGGGFYLTPDALPDDGKLDICIIKDIPKGEILKDIGKVFRGLHTELDPVIMNRCRKFHIQSDVPLPMHADGEVMSPRRKEVSVEVLPDLLKIVVPTEGQRSKG